MNQVGFDVMSEPAFAAGKPVMFTPGNDAPAPGFEAIDAGDLSIARVIEPYVLL
jgi:hypothetical protein